MGFSIASFTALLLILFSVFAFQSSADGDQTATLTVDVGSNGSRIPENFFGVFFEEINHAGTGGLWAELVNNRGFEAGGTAIPSGIAPWTIVGNETTIRWRTEPTSCFARNSIAVRLDILCPTPEQCPQGVGLSNPGFWGMNTEKGKKYKVIFYIRSTGSVDLKVAFKGSDGRELSSNTVQEFSKLVSTWTRMETILEARESDFNSSLEITTNKKGVIWLDQVSAMPMDTYNGHGYRKDLYQMVADLKPKFLRFPGGCYVEGDYLRNAFRWKETIGPWEKRPGHFNGMWGHWTDDGLGFFEFLQLAEDLGAAPVWIFNNGISHHDEVNSNDIAPFVQEALDGIEFARGSDTSTWGKVRADMGHAQPFDLKYVGIGNEDCGKENYQGNYLKFYEAIKRKYPDMQIISNCDATASPLQHPADLYDFHIYSSSEDFLSKYNKFDSANRTGAKAFVSEYAVWKDDAGKGTLLSALGEAAFLMGLEKNSDHVEMFCYAPLFLNVNDQTWIPDAIVYDSHQAYGIPSYWLQTLFTDSSGAQYLNSTLQAPDHVVASTIIWQDETANKSYLRIKVVNFNDNPLTFNIEIKGFIGNVNMTDATKTVLTSGNVRDVNSFDEPKKVAPQRSALENADAKMTVMLPPNSVTSFDLPK